MNIDIEDLKAFVRTKNPEERYNDCDPRRCPIAQYYEWKDIEFPYTGVPADIEEAFGKKIADAIFKSPATFGALLKRLS